MRPLRAFWDRQSQQRKALYDRTPIQLEHHELLSRNTKPLGLSTNTAEEHLKCIADVNETQHTDLQFPILADADL